MGEGAVLVAGMDPACTDELASCLGDRGLGVVPAPRAEDATRRLAAGGRDVVAVVVDAGLPRSERDAVATAANGCCVPLLCATADASPAVLREAMALGARDVLELPFGTDPEVGERVVAIAESGRALRRRLRSRDDQRIRQLEARCVDLESMFERQRRSFEESRETYYLDLARMMTIISNIMDGILFADRNGSITLMNPAAEDLTGVRSFMVIGKPVTSLTGQGELLDALAADHERSKTTGKNATQVVEVHHSEQDLLYIKMLTTEVSDYRGSFAGTLTVLQDVTAEHKSDQLKNQYLSIVAHELRTPLTGIKTFSTMMSKGTLGDLNDHQQRVVDSIREQSLRLEHQIDKLINLGYLDSDEYGQDLEVVDVDEFLRGCAAPFARTVEDRSITLGLKTPEGALVHADRADLRRALQALVENAVKFAPDGSEVRLIATVFDDEVEFRVADSGIGIDPRYHRRIFEKFFQVEDPLTRHHGGAGLGLFVARGIITAHGSKIEVESQLGGGAEFAFRLPKYEESRESAPAAAAVPS